MKKYITATVQNLADSEVLGMIPPDTLARIKQTDQAPVFKVYCVGHEGTADAQELSFGAKLRKAFQYVKDMIVKLNEKLTFGTAIFSRHVDTNEHAGRERIGELVGKGLRYIKDKLSAVAVCYIYPQYRQMPLDVASIEANVVYVPKEKDRAEVIDIDNVTGIALSSGAVDQPAFKGATLLGIVQAFTQTQHDRGEKMTKEEIIAAIKEANLTVIDVFSAEEITASEPAKKAKQTEYEHAKRVEKSLGEEREKVITLTKSLEDANKQVKTLNEAVSTTQVKSLFEESAPARKFTDKEKVFIQKNLPAFKSDKTGTELKTDFERFLDSQLKEFEDYAKMMGIDVLKDREAAQKATGAPSGDGKDRVGDEKDMSVPENNELIPK